MAFCWEIRKIPPTLVLHHEDPLRTRVCLTVLALLALTATAQSTGTIRGTVLLDTNGDAMHGARVVISPLRPQCRFR